MKEVKYINSMYQEFNLRLLKVGLIVIPFTTFLIYGNLTFEDFTIRGCLRLIILELIFYMVYVAAINLIILTLEIFYRLGWIRNKFIPTGKNLKFFKVMASVIPFLYPAFLILLILTL